MDREQLLQVLAAYRAAIAAGEDPMVMGQEVQRITGMGPAALEAHIAALDGGAKEVAPGLYGGHENPVALPDTVVQAGPSDSVRAGERRRPTLPSFLKVVGHYATGGLGDEIVGAVHGLIPGGPTGAEARAAYRQEIASARGSLSGGARLGAETLGAAVVPLSTGTRVGGAVLRGTGSRVAAGAAGGAAGGALGGGLLGLGEAEGPLPERLDGAALGAGVGAAAGGALGGGLGMVGRMAGRLRRGPTQRAADAAYPALREAMEEAGVTSAAPQGGRLRRFMSSIGRGDDLSGYSSALSLRLGEMGDGSVVADLGENLGRRARAAVNGSPELAAPGGPVQRIVSRTGETRDRIAGELRRATGVRGTLDDAMSAADDAVDQVRRTHYGPLEAQYPVVDGPNVAAALGDPRIAPVARRALGGQTRPPSFRELQDVLIDLRDAATAARRAGRPGRAARARAAYEHLEAAIAQDVPEFAAAQNAFRDAAAAREALGTGRRGARRNPADINREMAGLPPAARENYRRGMLETYESGLQEQSGGAAGRFIDAGPTMRSRLAILADDPVAFARLMQRLQGRERAWRATGQAVRGNSTTAQQLADMDAGVASMPTSASGLVQSAFQFLTRAGPRDRQAAENLVGRVLLAERSEVPGLLADVLVTPSRAAQVSAIGGGLLGLEAPRRKKR